MATCQQLRDQLNSLENEEVLLKAAVDIKMLAFQVAQQQFVNAQQQLMQAQMSLQNNLSQQYTITGQMNAMGCQ